MIQGLVAKKVIDVVLKKIVEKHKLNKLQKYVEQDNELDLQMKQVQKTISKQGRYIEELEKKVAILEKDSHPPIITKEEISVKMNQKDEIIKDIYKRLIKIEKEK